MSLAIILDKSSFQMLNIVEIVMLHNYFLPCITPVLVMEVLGDLRKEEEEGKSSKEKVIQLAKKLLPYKSEVNIHYPKLIEMNLKGDRLSLDNRPVVGDIIVKQSESGQKGFYHTQSAEEIALGKWREGQFSKTEELTAQLWRDITTEKDILINLQQQLKKEDAGTVEFKTMEKLKDYIDETLTNPENQKGLLQFCVTEFGIEAASADEIFARWEQCTDKNLSSFAPYAYHCCRVKLMFYIGLKNDLIGTRPTNHVDLQYLYYLPFSLIFSSNDNFHKKVIDLLMGKRHAFVTGEDLKKALKELVSYRETLSEKKDIERTLKEPPQIPSNLICQLWSKYLDWPPKYKRVISEKEMDEQKKKFEEFIAAKEIPGNPGVMDDPDFIVKEFFMSPDDLCPCGSGKTLGECHGKNYKGSSASR
jgi:hypothetical protein